MVIVVANDLPDVVRGHMKLWFVEPKANVFISGINDDVADKVINFLFEVCPTTSGLMVFKSLRNAPGYEIKTLGTIRSQVEVDFITQLIKIKPQDMDTK